MFDIGFLELVFIAIISLLVLGPERLPVAARTAGRWIGKARRMVSQFSREIDRQIEAEELREQLKKQGESLNINEDVKNIQETVHQALEEARSSDLDKSSSASATVGNQQAIHTPTNDALLDDEAGYKELSREEVKVHEFEPLPRDDDEPIQTIHSPSPPQETK